VCCLASASQGKESVALFRVENGRIREELID
jgi:hypothetical protein